MPFTARVRSTLVLSSLILAGCQALPSPRSDLRSQPSSSGTPLTEILARANAKEGAEENAGESEPSAAITESQSLLSIGLEPEVESDVEVTERSAQGTPTLLKTDAELPPLEEAELIVWPEQPAMASDAQSVDQPTDPATSEIATEQSEGTGTATATAAATAGVATEDALPKHEQQSFPPTISQQLNWLPSLDETLAGMDARFSESASLDEKIDALMSLAFVVDAKLYISFRELLDRLDAEQAQQLMAEQQSWLDQRKENLTRAYLEFKADKAGRYNAAQTFLRSSHSRMRVIDARLAAAN